MKKIRNPPTCILLIVAWLVLFLTACGPKYVIGLDAVAQTGRWMSVLQPVQDGSPLLTVVDVQTGEPELTLTEANIYRQPITFFSPNGEYLLYRTDEMWKLVEISNKNEWEIAPTDATIEFLRDDELLVTREQGGISSDGGKSQKVYQLSLVSPRSPGQDDQRRITNQGQYMFKNLALGLSTTPGSSYASDTPAQAFCPPALVLYRDTRVIVNSDRTVLVLTSDERGSNIRSLHKLSIATTDLLKTHEALQEALALKQIQEMPGYENLSEAEKAAMIDTIAHSGITGLVSPDGQDRKSVV